MSVFVYEVGERKFYQRTLCNYQETLVEELLFSLKNSAAIAIKDSLSLFQAIGSKRGELMAYCLIPEGMAVQEFVKQLRTPGFIDQQIEFFDFDEGVTPGLRYRVIADFFVCNQAGVCLEAIDNLMNQLQQAENKMMESQLEKSLNGSAPLSPEETQPTESLSTV